MIHTLILPGFSLKNKDWSEDVQRHLNLGKNSEVIYWRHWQTGNNSDFHLDYESQQISHKVLNKNYNILAKSVGTLVAMKVIRHSPTLLNKLILCGIPINDLNDEDFEDYKILHEVNKYKVTVFQNSTDPHGSYEQLKQFLGKIDENFKIIEKPRDDHDYPYFEDFVRIIN